jgi:sialic acid synthase SpsE
MPEQEKTARNAVRRSAFIMADMSAGTSLERIQIEFRRPSFGISPELFETLSGIS